MFIIEENEESDVVENFQTSRKTVLEMENILGHEFKILDKGFIRVIDYMGNDEAIVQSARVSYGKGTKAINKDEGLLRYLMRHQHLTPFEMCEIKFHIKLPIFIARQWIRHRTANVNEISGRYSVLNEEFFCPNIEDLCQQSKSAKQGRANQLNNDIGQIIKNDIEKTCENSFARYNHYINDHNLTREIARIVMPLSTYTEFYWKIDLRNLFNFLNLRSAPGAQKEIREYANKMLEITKLWVPLAYKAFVDYTINSVNFSRIELNELQNLLNKEKIVEFIKSKSETKNGEDKEFCEKLTKLLNL